jgi:hypothetical protein
MEQRRQALQRRAHVREATYGTRVPVHRRQMSDDAIVLVLPHLSPDDDGAVYLLLSRPPGLAEIQGLPETARHDPGQLLGHSGDARISFGNARPFRGTSSRHFERST